MSPRPSFSGIFSVPRLSPEKGNGYASDEVEEGEEEVSEFGEEGGED